MSYGIYRLIAGLVYAVSLFTGTFIAIFSKEWWAVGASYACLFLGVGYAASSIVNTFVKKEIYLRLNNWKPEIDYEGSEKFGYYVTYYQHSDLSISQTRDKFIRQIDIATVNTYLGTSRWNRVEGLGNLINLGGSVYTYIPDERLKPAITKEQKIALLRSQTPPDGNERDG